jgi:Sulfate permease family
MNAELMAHGYSNFAAGACSGLANYMTYSNSLLFAKSKVRAIFGILLELRSACYLDDDIIELNCLVAIRHCREVGQSAP